jgi:hypothetical protein
MKASPELSQRPAGNGVGLPRKLALFPALVWLVAGCAVASAAPALSGNSVMKRAAAICSWRHSAYIAALTGAGLHTADKEALYLGVASSIMRHRDAELPTLKGPASLDRSIRQLVSDNAKIVKVEDEARARFKRMPKQRRVTDAELRHYLLRPDASAENAAFSVVDRAHLPQACWPF